MTLSDRKAFLEIVIGFAELKGKKLSAPALELFWNAMQDWDISDFRVAAARLIKTCEFMPTPKDFEDLRKAARPTAGEAWAEALDIGRQGGRSSGNELIDRVVRAIGGYRAISMSPEDRTPFLERRFCEHYDAIADAEETRRELPRIASPALVRKLTVQR